MSTGTPCYCINPDCSDRKNFYGHGQLNCKSCDTPLMIQPQQFLLSQAIYGVTEQGNSEVFEITDFNFSNSAYPKIVKILQPNSAAIALKLFQQEAHLLQELKDVAVPRIEAQASFTVSVQQGQRQRKLHCLIMEKIEGETLETYIQNHGKINIEIALDWLRQIAQSLLEIHRRGIIHRDLKPSNIMVSPSQGFPYGKLVLIDFGTARKNTQTYLDKLFHEKSLTKVISRGYTAPEQQDGKCIFKSDLYSLGRIFIYLLTGKQPDELEEKQQSWQTLVVHFSMQQLLIKLTQTDPQKRIANAQAILDQITQIFKFPSPSRLNYCLVNSLCISKKRAIAFALTPLTFLLLNGTKPVIADKLTEQADNLYKQNPKQAEKFYDFALKLDKNNEMANFGKAYLCDGNKNFSCAEKYYLQAIAYSHDLNSVAYFFSINNYAKIQLRHVRNIETSIDSLEKIITIAQTEGRADIIYKNLGWAYLLKSDFPHAKMYLNKASETLKNNSELQCLQQSLEIAKATNQVPDVAYCVDIGQQVATN